MIYNKATYNSTATTQLWEVTFVAFTFTSTTTTP
jgi:hypothetical protein